MCCNDAEILFSFEPLFSLAVGWIVRVVSLLANCPSKMLSNREIICHFMNKITLLCPAVDSREGAFALVSIVPSFPSFSAVSRHCLQ